MNHKEYFDARSYFESICNSNKLAVNHHFKFCTCSGIEFLQEAIDNFRTTNAFFCFDDTNDGALFRNSGAWFKKRVFTIFLIYRHKFNDMAERAERLNVCRDLLNQITSRMIVDADDLLCEEVIMDVSSLLSREFGQYVLNGATGLYFMVEVAEPVDLQLDKSEWIN